MPISISDVYRKLLLINPELIHLRKRFLEGLISQWA